MSQGGWCAEPPSSVELVASDDADNTLPTPRGGWCTEPVSFKGDAITPIALAKPSTDPTTAGASTIVPITTPPPTPPVIATESADLSSTPTTGSSTSAPHNATAAGDSSRRGNAPSKPGETEEQLSMFKGQQVHRVGYARDVWALGKFRREGGRHNNNI